MKIALRSHPTKLAELNITPLLDLVFVLLVIFIITTPQLMNNLEMALPSEQHAAVKTEPMRIHVLGHDRALLDSKELSLTELAAELARRKAQLPPLAAAVDGADEADYQTVVDVLEILCKVGVTQVGLTTQH